MPQGLSANPPTAYPARPEASTTATGPVPQHPQARAQDNAPAERGLFSQPGAAPPNRSSTATSRWQQNQDRRAASATTSAPATSSRQFRDSPKLAILREPSFRRPAPQARLIRQGGLVKRFRHAVLLPGILRWFGRSVGAWDPA